MKSKSMNTNTRHVWIVEMRDNSPSGWSPTIGCALTKEEGQVVLASWKLNNPDDTFRLKWYRSV